MRTTASDLRHAIAMRFAALAMLLFAALPARAADVHHLYFSRSLPGSGSGGEIVRYVLVKGVPREKPDFRYSGNLYSTLAVDSTGTVYGGYYNEIDVFDHQSQTVSRIIYLPQLPRCNEGLGDYVDSLAIDAHDNLYVATENFFSGAPRRSQSDVKQTFCKGVIVFAPGARGNATPIAAFKVPGSSYYGMAVDPSGDLFIEDQPLEAVLEYASPLTQPRRVRTFTGPVAAKAGLLATDAAGDLYMQSYGPSGTYVAFYTPKDSGHGPPTRIVQTVAPYGLAWGLGLDRGYLYMADSTNHIEGYDALANGDVQPLFSVPASHGDGGTLVAGP